MEVLNGEFNFFIVIHNPLYFPLKNITKTIIIIYSSNFILSIIFLVCLHIDHCL